jgi:solute carrier family 25 protein 14/30
MSSTTVKNGELRPHLPQFRDEQVLAKALIAGSMCAFVAGCLNPFDGAKIRLQNQLNSEYQGFVGSLHKIFREEGYRGLCKGLEPSMWREISYSSIRIGIYEPIRRFLSHNKENPSETSPPIKLFSALLAGAIGSSLANPLDLIKTRFQAVLPGEVSPYRSTFHAIRTIFHQESFGGLYRGWVVTCTRASVLNSAQVGSYDSIKHNVLVKYFHMKEGFLLHFCAAMSAGVITTTAANPCKLLVFYFLGFLYFLSPHACSHDLCFSSLSFSVVDVIKTR